VFEMLRTKQSNSGSYPANGFQQRTLRYLAITVLLLPLLASCGSASAPEPGTEVPVQEQTQPADQPPSSQSDSGPSASTNPLDPFNPCELLTADEYESFFGDPPSPDAAPENIGPYRSCMVWDQSGSKFITLQLTHETAEQFKTEMESSAAMLDIELVPVEGMGDEAVSAAGLLRVRVGETVLQVLTWHQDVDQALDVSRQIAELALPRLP
jgi:hypothetical protein